MKETIIGGRVRYEDPELNSQMQSSSYFSFMDRHWERSTYITETSTRVTKRSSLQIPTSSWWSSEAFMSGSTGFPCPTSALLLSSLCQPPCHGHQPTWGHTAHAYVFWAYWRLWTWGWPPQSRQRSWISSGWMPRPSVSLSVLLRSTPSTASCAWNLVSSSACR